MPWLRCLLGGLLLLAMSVAQAGNIFFNFTIGHGRLALTNLGDSPAYYPVVYRLGVSGIWEELPPVGTVAPAELGSGARTELRWLPPVGNAAAHPLAATQPLLIRFFDQAGADFGQIAFLNPPPQGEQSLFAEYRDGLLHIRPPGGAGTSWLLWARQEGIEPLHGSLSLEQRQPGVRRIDWQVGMPTQQFDLGAAQPDAVLIHQTAEGLRMQTIARGMGAGSEQQRGWWRALIGLLAGLVLLGGGFWLARRRWPERMAGWQRLAGGCLIDALVVVCGVLIVATVLGIRFLNSPNWPTGGDTASHLLYAKLYADELLFSGKILPWMPEVFGGLPFLSYYFPLPFIVIAALSKVVGFVPAFKWGAFLAAMLLPGAVFVTSRRWLGFGWMPALFGALGALAFLLHEQNSIWGGNLLSTLAGEFAYSYGLFFAVLTLLAWARAIHLGRGWLLPALLEAACGFSHGFPLLLVGFSTALLLLDGAASGDRDARWVRFRRSFGLLLRGHLLAFALLAGWLWPLFEMHGLTIPNDAAFPVNGWRDLLPASLWPVLAAGVIGALALAWPRVREGWSDLQRSALVYLVGAAGMAAVAFIAGDQLGLADIRFFPPVWLLGVIVCGWLAGQALQALLSFARANALWLRAALAGVIVVGTLGWLAAQVRMVPDWGLWNHSGLQAKPQWNNLGRLFPVLQGDLWSPRLLFEHDPANNDLGSTRTLEALPMFLNGRPVLEGLYMESALLGPAIYQLQSEVSAQPSSPLVRFPSASLDVEMAARHMAFLHADTLLLRSERAKQAVEGSGLFDKLAEASPFAVYRLRQFDSALAEIVRLPLQLRPKQDWMQDAFAWYRLRSRFERYLPVYPLRGELPHLPETTASGGKVRTASLQRHELVFDTDAVGQPHLIKMAYHPRWQLASAGDLAVAGPGLMLVIPQEKQIRLVFGHTRVGWLGMLSTSAAALLVIFLLWRRRTAAAAALAEPAGWRRFRLVLLGWLALLLAGGYFGWQSPERVYQQAWEAFNGGRFAEAGERFARAQQLRRPPAKKEEALFWQAKAYENAGRREEAKARYRELSERFHGFWLPESLYTLSLLERQDGRRREAEALALRLREEYPNNPWTQRLDQGQ